MLWYASKLKEGRNREYKLCLNRGTILLRMLVIRMKDQNLQWDSENLKFTNNDAANELLHINYRSGWHL